MMARPNWTESRVFNLLDQVFKSGPYVLIPQVRNGTGYSRTNTRTADGIAVSVWPSRGLFFTGIEIKVSRSDWSGELADPEKSADMQKWCKHWYIATPKGIVQDGELPPTWGLIECTEKRATISKAAPVLHAQPPDMLFLCSVLRSAMNGVVPKSSTKEWKQRVRDAEAQGFENGEKCGQSAQNYELRHLKKAVETFEEATGVRIQDQWRSGKIGRAVKMLLDNHMDSARERLEDDRRLYLEIAERIEGILKE